MRDNLWICSLGAWFVVHEGEPIAVIDATGEQGRWFVKCRAPNGLSTGALEPGSLEEAKAAAELTLRDLGWNLDVLHGRCDPIRGGALT